VTVIELGRQVMGRVVPGGIAAEIATRHQDAGVDLRCATGVAEVRLATDGTLVLDLTDGDSLVCDLTVAGIGDVPDTALAEKAGLAVGNGIPVDTYLATSDPDVFAAVDCCSVSLSAIRRRGHRPGGMA